MRNSRTLQLRMIGGFVNVHVRITVGVVASVATVVIGAGAHAGPPVAGPSGLPCGVVLTTSPLEPGLIGEVHAGPLAPGNPLSGTVTCTVQVRSSTHAGSGVAAWISGTALVVLPPTVISVQALPTDPVYLCTEFQYSGGYTVYWHQVGLLPADGHWTTDYTSACKQVVSLVSIGKVG